MRIRWVMAMATVLVGTTVATASAGLEAVAAAPNRAADPAAPAAPAPAAPAPAAPWAPAPTAAVPPTVTAAVSATQTKWSSAATWGGTLPRAGQAVVIPTGANVLLDVSPPALASISVDGKLEVARRAVNLTAGWIMVHGSLTAGTPAQPFAQKLTITLNGAPGSADVMGMGTRGIMVMGGTLALHGVSPGTPWTKLAAHAAAGSSALTLATTPAGWAVSDQIVVAPTDFYGRSRTQRVGITSLSGTTVNTSAPLTASRWGLLQYVSPTGLTLTPTTAVTPLVLDERAEVGNLTRRIVIQSVSDTAFTTNGFGAHVMAMAGSTLQLDGVEIRRAGQRGASGRYPVHFHQLSYGANGQVLADATASYVRNSSVWSSRNRCIVLHATNGVSVQRNVCFDIDGHGIFLEDAVERRNLIEDNLVLRVNLPSQPLKVHETDVFEGGPSGFWLTNPDNTVRGNVAADAPGNGFWLSFPRAPLGISTNVAIKPDNLPFGVFERNTAHSTLKSGVMLEWIPTNGETALTENKYAPTIGGAPDDYTNRLRFTLRSITTYKGGNGGYRNRATLPDYVGWVSADNTWMAFSGAVDDATISDSLVVGTSLNVSRLPDPSVAQVAFASYHSTAAMKNNVVVNFPFVERQNSGAFATHDYYTIPVDKGPVRNPGNRLINTSPGYRMKPPLMDPTADPNENWTLAGALWDPYGYWGTAGQYWTYDVPFLTSGATCQPVAPAGTNGVSCGGEYLGVGDFVTDVDPNRYDFRSPIEVARQTSAGAEIGRWIVDDGVTSNKLGNMRHFAARSGGRYVLRFPDRPLPKLFEATMWNAYRTDDSILMAVSFDGTATPHSVYTVVGQHGRNDGWSPGDPVGANRRPMTATTSLALVQSSTGNRYWQDRANNLIWFKYVGGLSDPWAGADPQSDDALYRPRSVIIDAT